MVGLAYAGWSWDARLMRLRLFAAPAIAAAVITVVLAVACGGGLPEGEFPLDAAALDLPSCMEDGSSLYPISSINCTAASCPGTTAYAVCIGTTYSACKCTGNGNGDIDSGMVEEAIMTGTEGGTPDVGTPDDTGPSDTGPVETGPMDSGPKDSGKKDAGPKDTGLADTGSADGPG
jgi:hypothetical protein